MADGKYKNAREGLKTGKRLAQANYNHISRQFPATIYGGTNDPTSYEGNPIARGAISELLSKDDPDKTFLAAKLAYSSGDLDKPSIQRRIKSSYEKALKNADEEQARHIYVLMETTDKLSRKQKESPLVGKIALFLAILAGGIGITLMTPTLTGNVVGNNSTSSFLGVILIIFGLTGSYFYFRER